MAEGTKAIDFYVLLRGAAKVTVGGRTRRRLASGDYFGEVSVLDGGPRTATVTAEEPVGLFRLERKVFVSVLLRNPEIAVKILKENGLSAMTDMDEAVKKAVALATGKAA